MTIDPRTFHLLNVADTCAIWNLLSSVVFYSAANTVGCTFCCTEFVRYECLYKMRTKTPTSKEIELKERFIQEQKKRIKSYSISIEDLQTIEVLSNRTKVSKGELSTIVFAKKTQQAFLSDDKQAIRLARSELDNAKVQTTPHLLSFLFYNGHLLDHDKDVIMNEHKSFERGGMRIHYENAYLLALKYRLYPEKRE